MDKIKKDLLTSWHERIVRLLISKMYKDQHEKKILKCEANTCLIFEIVKEVMSEGG